VAESTTPPARPTGAAYARTLESLRLQTPQWVYFGGKLRPWEEATLHISAEAVVRGLNVFEGLKGYWQADGGFGFVHLRRHYERLVRSARLLYIPVSESYEEYEAACFALTNALLQPSHDLYVRSTLYVVEGHYGVGTRADLVLVGLQWERKQPQPITLGVSTWRRASDVVMPPRIKTGTNYQVARLARIEGSSRGHEDMILLNDLGRVAESTGACVLLVREGRVITPPTTEGALESITLDVVEALSDSLGIPFERRPIDRTELYVADELGLTGTLNEITFVKGVDEYALPAEQPILNSLLARYLDAVRGVMPHPAVELSLLPPERAAGVAGAGRP
jgi:branched-chain amino acid aminotransferase